MNMSVEDAFKKSIETVVDWIGTHVNMSKTQVYFRTYAPVHFRFAASLSYVYKSFSSIFIIHHSCETSSPVYWLDIIANGINLCLAVARKDLNS